MRRILTVSGAIGFLAVIATSSAGQSSNDVAAWYALTFTPYGSLPPIVTRAMAGLPRAEGNPGRALEIRFGRYSFDEDQDDESFQSVGVGGRTGPFGFVVGYQKCGECADGFIMAGVDFESVLRSQTFASAGTSLLSVGLRPAFGASMFTGDSDLYSLAATIDLPVSASVPVGTSGRLVPFVSPGLGVGRFRPDDTAETNEIGFRTALGAGVGFIASNGLGVHLGWRKVFLEEAPSTLGLGISWAR